MTYRTHRLPIHDPKSISARPVVQLRFALASGTALAEDQVVNLYSARHYSTDEALYSDFTKATGIKVNRVDADDAGILARLKAEGSASPADVVCWWMQRASTRERWTDSFNPSSRRC